MRDAPRDFKTRSRSQQSFDSAARTLTAANGDTQESRHLHGTAPCYRGDEVDRNGSRHPVTAGRVIRLPAVKGWMAFLHGDERAAAARAWFASVAEERAFYGRAIA